jgi:hypothetical protein
VLLPKRVMSIAGAPRRNTSALRCITPLAADSNGAAVIRNRASRRASPRQRWRDRYPVLAAGIVVVVVGAVLAVAGLFSSVGWLSRLGMALAVSGIGMTLAGNAFRRSGGSDVQGRRTL